MTLACSLQLFRRFVPCLILQFWRRCFSPVGREVTQPTNGSGWPPFQSRDPSESLRPATHLKDLALSLFCLPWMFVGNIRNFNFCVQTNFEGLVAWKVNCKPLAGYTSSTRANRGRKFQTVPTGCGQAFRASHQQSVDVSFHVISSEPISSHFISSRARWTWICLWCLSMGSEEDRRDQGSEFEPRDFIKHGPETMTWQNWDQKRKNLGLVSGGGSPGEPYFFSWPFIKICEKMLFNSLTLKPAMEYTWISCSKPWWTRCSGKAPLTTMWHRERDSPKRTFGGDAENGERICDMLVGPTQISSKGCVSSMNPRNSWSDAVSIMIGLP